MDVIKVKVWGQTSPGSSVSVTTQALGNSQPKGTGKVSFKYAWFYDVRVQGAKDGTATVSVTNDSIVRGCEMQYWHAGSWVDAENQSVSGTTINGDVPVKHLQETPIVVGTN